MVEDASQSDLESLFSHMKNFEYELLTFERLLSLLDYFVFVTASFIGIIANFSFKNRFF